MIFWGLESEEFVGSQRAKEFGDASELETCPQGRYVMLSHRTWALFRTRCFAGFRFLEFRG